MYIALEVEGHCETFKPFITSVSDTPLVLGHPWLKKHNPGIDWHKKTIDFARCPADCTPALQAIETIANKLAEKAHKNEEKPLPAYLSKYADVFLKEQFKQLPPHRTWDHAIDLVPDLIIKRSKVYPLSPAELKALNQFLEENQNSGRIRPSKSPMTSLVFFVKKKDGSLQCVQDYWHLNSQTIKNTYLIPFISTITEGMVGQSLFSKLDICWGYNNQ